MSQAQRNRLWYTALGLHQGVCRHQGFQLFSNLPALLVPEEPSLITIAHNSHVLVVIAVVDAPAMAPALAQGRLPALAVHIVQEDGSAPLAEGHGGREGDGVATAQLATHHVGVHDVPVVIADCPPGAIVEDLHAPLAPAGPIGKSNLWKDGHR